MFFRFYSSFLSFLQIQLLVLPTQVCVFFPWRAVCATHCVAIPLGKANTIKTNWFLLSKQVLTAYSSLAMDWECFYNSPLHAQIFLAESTQVLCMLSQLLWIYTCNFPTVLCMLSQLLWMHICNCPAVYWIDCFLICYLWLSHTHTYIRKHLQ